ncbi:hypothetical protein B0T17DRAFT_649535 [Bombardia bombarda]|uniref:Uncharacterized protein n=1 Tax=Bombardia bombarda TaxID=252184 RepID=A0AA39XHV9_9PEZI|nr:hypothetical protein B0T17DRAFT_649535 [Bombardia bombarda]
MEPFPVELLPEANLTYYRIANEEDSGNRWKRAEGFCTYEWELFESNVQEWYDHLRTTLRHELPPWPLYVFGPVVVIGEISNLGPEALEEELERCDESEPSTIMMDMPPRRCRLIRHIQTYNKRYAEAGKPRCCPTLDEVGSYLQDPANAKVARYVAFHVHMDRIRVCHAPGTVKFLEDVKRLCLSEPWVSGRVHSLTPSDPYCIGVQQRHPLLNAPVLQIALNFFQFKYLQHVGNKAACKGWKDHVDLETTYEKIKNRLLDDGYMVLLFVGEQAEWYVPHWFHHGPDPPYSAMVSGAVLSENYRPAEPIDAIIAAYFEQSSQATPTRHSELKQIGNEIGETKSAKKRRKKAAKKKRELETQTGVEEKTIATGEMAPKESITGASPVRANINDASTRAPTPTPSVDSQATIDFNNIQTHGPPSPPQSNTKSGDEDEKEKKKLERKAKRQRKQDRRRLEKEEEEQRKKSQEEQKAEELRNEQQKRFEQISRVLEREQKRQAEEKRCREEREARLAEERVKAYEEKELCRRQAKEAQRIAEETKAREAGAHRVAEAEARRLREAEEARKKADEVRQAREAREKAEKQARQAREAEEARQKAEEKARQDQEAKAREAKEQQARRAEEAQRLAEQERARQAEEAAKAAREAEEAQEARLAQEAETAREAEETRRAEEAEAALTAEKEARKAKNQAENKARKRAKAIEDRETRFIESQIKAYREWDPDARYNRTHRGRGRSQSCMVSIGPAESRDAQPTGVGREGVESRRVSSSSSTDRVARGRALSILSRRIKA